MSCLGHKSVCICHCRPTRSPLCDWNSDLTFDLWEEKKNLISLRFLLVNNFKIRTKIPKMEEKENNVFIYDLQMCLSCVAACEWEYTVLSFTVTNNETYNNESFIYEWITCRVHYILTWSHHGWALCIHSSMYISVKTIYNRYQPLFMGCFSNSRNISV